MFVACPNAAEVAEDRRPQEADRRARPNGVLRPPHEVVRERLHLDAVPRRSRRHVRVLAAGHGLQDADVPAARRPADQLRRPQDGRVKTRVSSGKVCLAL